MNSPLLLRSYDNFVRLQDILNSLKIQRRREGFTCSNNQPVSQNFNIVAKLPGIDQPVVDVGSLNGFQLFSPESSQLSPADSPAFSGPVLFLAGYKDLLIYVCNDHIRIARGRAELAMFPSRTLFNNGRPGHMRNSNRSVRLKGDILYFLDNNRSLFFVNLALAEKGRWLEALVKLEANLLDDFIEDFDVRPNELVTLTAEGLLTIGEDSVWLAESSPFKDHKFCTVDTLRRFVVVSSFNPHKKIKYYSLYDTKLHRKGWLKSESEYAVQNLLLKIRGSILHIIAANNCFYVEYLVYARAKLRIVGTYEVTENCHIYGITWINGSREAMVFGVKLAKRIKL